MLKVSLDSSLSKIAHDTRDIPLFVRFAASFSLPQELIYD